MKAGTTTGLRGVTVKLSGSRTATATTLADGSYKFTNLPAGGTYTVKPTLSGYNFTAASRSYSSMSANQMTTNFTARQASAMLQDSRGDAQLDDQYASRAESPPRAVDVLAGYNRLLELAGG
jgi:hypothetical protein